MTDLRTFPTVPTVPTERSVVDVDDRVVLLDDLGRPDGDRPRLSVHDRRTPFHLGFSCYLVDGDGRVLITRRALDKRTWPGVWTNACCGHPRPGEPLAAAVARRLDDELGLRVDPGHLALALPDFVYRARMDDGCAEHELCPVVVAEVDGPLRPDPAEVADHAWVAWDDLVTRAREHPDSLSPWAVLQIAALDRRAPSPAALLAARPAVAAVPDLAPAFAPLPPPSPDGGGHADEDPLVEVRAAVDAVIEGFLAEREREVGGLAPAALEIAGEVRRLVEAGGKRLRPAFLWWGHRAAGGDPSRGAAVAAAALELLHTFALLHDDVMDRSLRRRGRPTAHVALARLHHDRELTGDDGWFGTTGALLAGDLCSAWADQLFHSIPLPPDTVAAGRRVFDRLRVEVIAGQYLDVRQSHHPATDEETALRVALLKSARYTVTRPLQLGAALAGATDDDGTVAALSAYGDAVGMAFQMRDDVLGLFGDPTSTGKNGIDDLREGKRTLLVVRALRLTDGDDHDVLWQALGDPGLGAAGAARCRRIVAASGARASIEALIAAEQQRAVDAIAGLDPTAGRPLTRLAALASHRDR